MALTLLIYKKVNYILTKKKKIKNKNIEIALLFQQF